VISKDDDEEKVQETIVNYVDNHSHDQAPPARALDWLQSTSTGQPPPYPKRSNLDKPPMQLEFDFLGNLKNVCITIPLF
jgi:hypothetical protein